MTQKEAVKYWLKSSQENKKAAEDVFKANHPEWGFFLYHLSLEKLIKGLMIKNGEIPPPIHDLEKLSEKAKLNLNNEQLIHI